MKPKPIGIIGGAGPLAGAFLLDRVLSLSNKKYGCYRDADYPKIILISFPFSEMLTTDFNPAFVQEELSACLQQLRTLGAEVIAIACNTLHAFLDKKDLQEDLIQLPLAVAKEISTFEKPLVFCTSTSAKFGLHKQFFDCAYPDLSTQREVDDIIDQILKGSEKQKTIKRLEKLLQEQKEGTVILGCTELSLFTAEIFVPNKLIIDPLEVVATRIVEKSFSNNRSYS